MQKIVYLPAGTGTALDNLNKMLENGWYIREIHAVNGDDAGCFVWIEKNSGK